MNNVTQRYILIALQIVALVVLTGVALFAYPPVVLPVVLVCSGGYYGVRWIYSRCCNPHPVGEFALLLVAILMSVGMLLNLQSFCPDSMLATPMLNNADAAKHFSDAVNRYHDGCFTCLQPYSGYTIIVALIWKLTGINVLVPLLLNYIFILLSILGSGLIAHRTFGILYPDDCRNGLRESLTMLFSVLVCYYIGCGMSLLKEPMVYLGVVLAIYAMLGLAVKQPYRKWMDVVIFTVAVSLLFATRNSVIIVLLIGCAVLVRKHNFRRIVLVMIIGGLGVATNYCVVDNDFDRGRHVIESSGLESAHYLSDNADNSRSAFNKSVEGYFSYPVWKKMALLPYSLSVQYFIPFSWTYRNSIPFGTSQPYSHFGYFWYIIGGGVLFFILFGKKLLKAPPLLWHILTIAAIGYLIPAYFFAGSVSRYWLPYTPLFALVASYTVVRVLEVGALKIFRNYYIIYVFVIVAVLLACYDITTA